MLKKQEFTETNFIEQISTIKTNCKKRFRNINIVLFTIAFFTHCSLNTNAQSDDCATATLLSPQSYCSPNSGTTVGATQSLPAIACTTTGVADDDVWYKFVATGITQTVTVIGVAAIDIVIDVRSGGCNGTSIGCADGAGEGGTETVFLSGLTSGDTYFIRIYSYGSAPSSRGDFNICLISPPSNDDCTNAIALTPSTTCNLIQGTTKNATQSLQGFNCSIGVADDDVWYKFVATGVTQKVTAYGVSTVDVIIEVRSGVCNGTIIGCSDNSGDGGTENVFLSGLTSGDTYFIRIYGYGSTLSSQGDFYLCVISPPSNDDCTNAISLDPSSYKCNLISGTTINATPSLPPILCNGNTGDSDDDVWYKFVATNPIHFVTVEAAGWDPVVEILSGGCNGSSITCADEGGANHEEFLELQDLAVGDTYYIRVYSYGSSFNDQHAFRICVNEPGDFCVNAISLTPGVVCSYTAGTTVGAEPSVPAITCGSLIGEADDDVWYKFIATSGTHTIKVVGDPLFDAVIDFYSGSCPGTNIGCADQTGDAGTESLTMTSLTIGETYYFRIYSYDLYEGTFNICITAPPVANNDCDNAISLIPSNTCSSIEGTTLNATQSLPAITCGTFTGTADDDVWFKFVATSTFHTVRVGGVIDVVVDVRSGACEGTNIACADALTNGLTEVVQLSGLTIGDTYYIRVYSFGSSPSDAGNFQICVTTPGDQCTSAIPLTPNASCIPTAGSTINATSSLLAITCGVFTGTADDDVWYNFVATNSTHTITVVCGGTFDAVIDVRSGSCDGFNIACADAEGSGGTETFNVNGLIPGNNYYIRIYSFGSGLADRGTFNICVTFPSILANDDCANAILLTPATTCIATDGTTVGATQSLPEITCNGHSGTSDDDVWFKFVATSTTHTVTVDGAQGFDAFVDVRSGACDGSNIDCADANGNGGTEVVSLSGLTIGDTYFIRVYGYGNGPTTQGSFTICVSGAVATSCSLTCPGNITKSNDANQCGAVVTFPLATTTGSCGTPVASPASGTFFPVGPTTVSVTEPGGQTCSFIVKVNDTQAPVITCSSNITKNNDPNQCGAIVNYVVTASDNCPGVTVSSSPASGSFFPKGTTTVYSSSLDASGNSATCSFTVTVNTSNSQPAEIFGPAGACCGQKNVTYCITPIAGATSYTWTLPANTTVLGSSNGPCITLSFGNNYNGGSICVKPNVSCGNGLDKCINIPKISLKPSTPGNITGPSSLCSNTCGTFSVAALSGATFYQWTASSGLTITSGQGTNTIVVCANSTFSNGTVSVYAKNCKGNSGTKTKVVTGKTGAPVWCANSSGDNKTIACGGSTYSYAISAIPGTNEFVWTAPTNAIINDRKGHSGNPLTVTGPDSHGLWEVDILFPANFISGNVSVAGQNSCGIGSTATLAVKSKPSTPGSISGNANVCKKSTKCFTISSVPGATNYVWTVSGGAIIKSGQGSTNLCVKFNSCSSNSVTLTVKANNVCGSSAISSKTISVNNSCKTAPDVSLSTEADVPTSFVVYPNPTTGKATLIFNSDHESKYSLKVVDMIGRILISEKMSMAKGYNTNEINLENLAKGVYYILMQTEGEEIQTLRIVVE